MDPGFEEAFEDLIDSQIGDHLHESVINRLQKMNHPREAIWQARTLKDNGNVCFKAEEISMAIEMYERALQFLCVGAPICAQDAQLMSELAVTLNSNLAACWLRLKEYNRAIEHCDLAMRFDAYNVKVRYRRALAFLSLDLVEEARVDLLIALKLEPKNKIVSRELKKLEDKYGTIAESSNPIKEQGKGKKVFDPLSTHITTRKDNRPKSPRDERRDDVSLETFGTGEEVPKGCPSEPMEDGYTSLGSSKRSCLESSICTSGEVEVGSRCPSGMDIDNQSVSSSLSEESLGEHPITAGTSPAAQSCDQLKPKTANQEIEEMVCFSNPRRPNQYLRISRKAYNDLVNGRQLSFVLAPKQDHMDIRVFAGPNKESTPMETCMVKDVELNQDDKSRKMGEEDSDSTSAITTEDSILHGEAHLNEDEVEVTSMEWYSAEVKNKDEGTTSPVIHSKFPVFFQAMSKTRGRKNKTTHVTSRAAAASSNHKQVCKRIMRTKFFSVCRNMKESQLRKRKSCYSKHLEDLFSKRRCIATVCNKGLYPPSLVCKTVVSVCPDGASDRETH